MIGRCYLLRGEPVVVLERWGPDGQWSKPPAPRNVLVLHVDGRKVVRPFRGLRRLRLRDQLA